MIAALNPTQHDLHECGNCIAVQAADGTGPTVKVLVWDTCPECADGSIDLSEEAFVKLEPTSVGRFQVKWSVCHVLVCLHI